MRRIGGISIISALLFAPSASNGRQVGGCEHGVAEARLDVNGVSATVYNNGNLFYNGGKRHYNVPVATPAQSIYAANLWIGGLVNGEVRFSGGWYGPSEMWPGPIDDPEDPPYDCSQFDHIYKVSRRDIGRLDATGLATADIRDWPWQLGAPVDDGDGNTANYDVHAGDRPGIEGDQSIWWVMNDLAGVHEIFGGRPLGVEVRVMASAVSAATDGLHHTTFYRYTLVNRSGSDIDSMYFGMRVDPDLGYFNDDYVGSDTSLGLAYAWNGDDFDEGPSGYGDRPPAIGFTVVEGPPMSHFNAYVDHACMWCTPRDTRQAFGYMRSLIPPTARPVTYGGHGYAHSEIPAPFMFPGRPPAYWSEESAHGEGERRGPGFREFVWSSGPFSLSAGASEDIVVAIIWVQGEDRFDSVYRLLDTTPAIKDTYTGGLPITTYPELTVRPELRAPGANAHDQPTNLTFFWSDLAFADGYELELSSDTGMVKVELVRTTIRPGESPADGASTDLELATNSDYTWRVRPLNPSGYGPWSESRSFSTGARPLSESGPLLIPGTDDPAFIQVAGIGDDDACGPNAGSTYGCSEVGGNFVYFSLNGSEDWIMTTSGPGPEETIGQFAPHGFEIRVTDEASYGYHLFTSGRIISVPFETWDIGDVGPFGVNDTSDDVRLIPVLFSEGGDECYFGFGEVSGWPEPGWEHTDRIYAYYPTTVYSEWEVLARLLVEVDPDGCPSTPETDSAATLIDTVRDRPLQRLGFTMDTESPDYRPEMIPIGNVIRFLTLKLGPPQPSAPSSGSTVSSEVTLYWQLPRNEDTARVQISTLPDFSTLVREELVAGKHLHVTGLDQGGYFWRVSYGGEEWSDVWDFVVVPGTSVEDDGFGLPTALELMPPYPNPSDGPRSLVYGVPGRQRVSLAVYDLLGREVEVISDREQPAGWHAEIWNPKALSAGVYFIVLDSGSERLTQPVVVAR